MCDLPTHNSFSLSGKTSYVLISSHSRFCMTMTKSCHLTSQRQGSVTGRLHQYCAKEAGQGRKDVASQVQSKEQAGEEGDVP